MPLQSITKPKICEKNFELDQRTYREAWPSLRLNEASAERFAAGARGVGEPNRQIVTNINQAAEKINVAIVDSGIPDGESGSPFHPPDHAPAPGVALSSGHDRDDDGHATHLAATIRDCNSYAAQHIDLRFVKPFSAQGWPTPDHCADAIKEAADLGAHVIVLAWDTGQTTSELKEAILGVRERAVVVIAAGNWSLDIDKHPNWPASYGREEKMDHVITVMATDEQDERASYSNYGKESVYIAAPGLAILRQAQSLNPLRTFGSLRDSDRNFRGTSAATAHVARLAALVLAENSGWSPQQVKKHIGDTARPVKTLKKFGITGVEKLCVTEAIVDFGKALRAPAMGTLQS